MDKPKCWVKNAIRFSIKTAKRVNKDLTLILSSRRLQWSKVSRNMTNHITITNHTQLTF